MDQLLNIIDPHDIDLIIRLLVATTLGLVIGTERELAHKTAGMRTYALTALGSALFVIIAQEVVQDFSGITNYDPLRMAAQVVSALGFLCAGIVFFRDTKVTGLTTAAGVWVTGGIGIAVGYGLYTLGLAATISTLFIFTVLWYVEQRIKKITGSKENGE